MNYVVTLYFLSAMLHHQVAACNPHGGGEDTIDNDTVTIGQLRKFITGLKANYEEELIDIKMREAKKIYQIMFNTSRLVRNQMIEVGEMRQNVRWCYNSFRYNLTKMTIAATNRQRECIGDNMEILKPVEEDIEQFLNNVKLCLLNYDFIKAQVCLANESKQWAECNNENNYSASTNGKEKLLKCDEAELIPRKIELEKSAMMFRGFGLMYVTDCLLQLEIEYKTLINVTSNYGMECVKNANRQ